MNTALIQRFCLPVVLLLVLSSCVMFVSPYDEINDKAITDLETKTEQFFVKMDATKGSYEANKSFYTEAKGSIQSIRLRAEAYGKDKNKGELADLDRLDQTLENLKEIHRLQPLSLTTGTPGAIARLELETIFGALLQIEIQKKLGVSGAAKSS